MKPLQIAIKNAAGKAKYTNGSYLENWYVQKAPINSKQAVIIVGTPGTALFATLSTSPVLGGMVMGDLLYVATPTKFYSINASATVTEIGTVSLGNNVTMAINGVFLGFTGDNGNGYYYSVAGGLQQWSGAGWLNYQWIKSLDNYFIFAVSDDSDVYGISSVNGVSIDPTEITYAESKTDDLLAHETLNGEIFLFGSKVTEVHYNSADVDFPFEKRQGVLIERGILAPYTLVKESTLFWLGDDRVFYQMSGYQEQRISDHEFEESISVGDVDDAHAYIYTEEGHKFIVVTFPSLSLTWAYDMVTGLWARRSHSQFSGRHHSNCFFKAFGKNLVGDFQNGNIYHMTLEAADDNGDNIIRDMILPTIHADRERSSQGKFEARMSVGTVTDSSDPEALIRWSDDGLNTWSNWHRVKIGKKGKYLTRVRKTRMGQFRERNINVRISEPIKHFVIAGCYGDFS